MGNKCDCLSSAKDEQADLAVANPNKVEAMSVENSAESKANPRRRPSSALKPLSSGRDSVNLRNKKSDKQL